MPVNVLYLGMAHDVMAPLLLVPDLDTLYVLNSLDDTYGTWEEHKERIRKVLLQGSDKNIAESYLMNRSSEEKNRAWFKVPEDKNWRNVHTLEGPSEILLDEDIPDSECLTEVPEKTKWCYTKSVWKLQFLYNGKVRNLIYYYNFNFAFYTWPSEIKDIQYHIWNGAYAWESMMEYPEEERLRDMMIERSAPESYVFALSFNHKKFPEHIWVYNGHERYGQSIAKMKLNFSDPNWWKKNYSQINNNTNNNTNGNNSENKSNQSGGKKHTRKHKNRRQSKTIRRMKYRKTRYTRR